MITLEVKNQEPYQIQSTIFPDGTSQVWKLPESLLNLPEYFITWNFQEERELFDLASLVTLLKENNYCNLNLHVPYLPYARQDKEVSNESTFNLQIFASLLNSLNFNRVSIVDAHNKDLTSKFIKNVIHCGIEQIHNEIIYQFKPDFLFFPDEGALKRYEFTSQRFPSFFGKKIRNQLTGKIEDYQIDIPENIKAKSKILIIDDICDGGATFVEAAKQFRNLFGMYDRLEIGLFVTHGIFSRGKEHLLNNGIDKVWTTNSLPKNKKDFKV